MKSSANGSILSEEWINDLNHQQPDEGQLGMIPDAYDQEYSLPDFIPLIEHNVV